MIVEGNSSEGSKSGQKIHMPALRWVLARKHDVGACGSNLSHTIRLRGKAWGMESNREPQAVNHHLWGRGRTDHRD